MIGRFLCRIGIHRWRHVGMNLHATIALVQCRRCGRQGCISFV